MQCPQCGVQVPPKQKFCGECGAAVPTAPADALPPPSALTWGTIDTGDLPATQAIPTPPIDTAELPATQAVTMAVPAPVAPAPPPPGAPGLYNQALDWDTGVVPTWDSPAPTMANPTTASPTMMAPAVAVRRGFRATPLVVTSLVVAALAVISALVDVISFSVTGDQAASGKYLLNDFSSNFLVGAIIGAVLLFVGGMLAGAGFRFGAGLAAGAALAIAGLFCDAAGRAIAQVDALQVQYLQHGGSYTITTTWEAGFYLILGTAVLCALVVGFSFTRSGRDRVVISPIVGALGALGSLLIALGTLVPTHGASFNDNFSQDAIPPGALYLRLVPLGLVLLAGVIGFLLSRPWGIGLALGSISIAIWQTVTALADAGNRPFAFAGGNFSPGITAPSHPYVVVIVGVAVAALSAAGGLLSMLPRATDG